MSEGLCVTCLHGNSCVLTCRAPVLMCEEFAVPERKTMKTEVKKKNRKESFNVTKS